MGQELEIKGTWEEIAFYASKFKAGTRFRLIPLLNESQERSEQNEKKESFQPPIMKELKGFGKFAGIIGGSEEFISRKQDEIDLEDGRRD